jgi:hypothetical protein
MNSASGKAVIDVDHLSVAALVAASEASGGASMNSEMWLWSSTGASSLRELSYSGHGASHDQRRRGDHRPAHP